MSGNEHVHVCTCKQCSPQVNFKAWQEGKIWVEQLATSKLPFPYQRKVCTEGLLGRHALCMLGRTLVKQMLHKWYFLFIWSKDHCICDFHGRSYLATSRFLASHTKVGRFLVCDFHIPCHLVKFLNCKGNSCVWCGSNC